MKQIWFVFLNCDAHEIIMIVITVDGIGFGFKCPCLLQLHHTIERLWIDDSDDDDGDGDGVDIGAGSGFDWCRCLQQLHQEANKCYWWWIGCGWIGQYLILINDALVDDVEGADGGCGGVYNGGDVGTDDAETAV